MQCGAGSDLVQLPAVFLFLNVQISNQSAIHQVKEFVYTMRTSI